ncbi:unnamed protein product [Agarophyton chilense]
MLRLLNFISREEVLTEKSVSDDESETCDFDEHRTLPNVLDKGSTLLDNELSSSPDAAERLCQIHNPQSKIADNDSLTDCIINQASQITISNLEPNEQSSLPYSSDGGRVSATENLNHEQVSTTPTLAGIHPIISSTVRPHSDLGHSQNSLYHDVMARAKSEESLDGTTNDIRKTLSTSADGRLCSAFQVLSSFSHLDMEDIEIGKPPSFSFEELQQALRDLPQVMVWADQHEPRLWELFLELGVMRTLVKCLCKTKDLGAHLINLQTVNPKEHNRALEDVLVGMTKVESDDGNASKTTETRHEKEQVYNENKTENPSSSPSFESEDEVVHEEHAGSTKYEKGKNESMTDDVLDGGLDEFLPSKVQSHVLQAISIMVQSVSRRHSLLCLFAANHINEIMSFEFAFDEEMIAAFISTVKTITIRLDRDLLQLFFDPVRSVFPLYDVVTKFYGHPESMIRIAIRNITLAIYAIGDPEVLKYVARDGSNYFINIIYFLSKISGSVARAFELLLDDGREVRRTRTRTGLFRRKVRVSDVTDRLEEIENICAYLNDVCVISRDVLRPRLIRLLLNRFFSPFFRPLASLASPDAVRARNKLWRLGNRQNKPLHKTALAVFDAAARCLLLSCILIYFRSSVLSESVTVELRRFATDFERRSILHALKAMASDITGTERVTFVSLCAIEAFISCKSVEKHFLRDFQYDLQVDNTNRNTSGELRSPRISFLDLEAPQRDDLERSHDEPMLMTLSAFEAPLTPSNSLPSTPDFRTVSSEGTLTPTALSRATSTASLSSDLGASVAERGDSEGILSSFQLGDATLRQALSSIVLVVRRREVRSMRVLYAICRIISSVGAKTQEYGLCTELYKIVLDELAGLMQSVLRDGRTTIVFIERMFESFRMAASTNQEMYSDPPKLEDVLSSDRVPLMASMLPKGAGKKRRALLEDATPPTEIEDADAFFVMIHAYEKSLTNAGITKLPNLVLQARGILLEYDLPDSYLDKRDALINFAEAVLLHGEVE